MLNLDELNMSQTVTKENRLKIFIDILKTCHNKIRKYNSEFKKHDCLFEPPVFIIGKPPYNYPELIDFLVKSLKKNGIKAEWLQNKKAVYVSWSEKDIDMNQYHNQFTSTSYSPTETGTSTSQPFSILTVKPHDTGNNAKKKKKKGEQQSVQHVAMLEYKPGVKDYVPINIKALRN
jgi:hypothetical protein